MSKDRELGTITVETATRGFRELVQWASQFGVIDRVGIEARAVGVPGWRAGCAMKASWSSRSTAPTGAPGTVTARCDTIDAVAAARAIQSGEASGAPKAGDGDVEAIRVLRVAYRSAVKARTQAANQLRALVVTAPDDLRHQLRGLRLGALVAMPPGCIPATPRTRRRP